VFPDDLYEQICPLQPYVEDLGPSWDFHGSIAVQGEVRKYLSTIKPRRREEWSALPFMWIGKQFG
jgi:hypothetical protein